MPRSLKLPSALMFRTCTSYRVFGNSAPTLAPGSFQHASYTSPVVGSVPSAYTLQSLSASPSEHAASSSLTKSVASPAHLYMTSMCSTRAATDVSSLCVKVTCIVMTSTAERPVVSSQSTSILVSQGSVETFVLVKYRPAGRVNALVRTALDTMSIRNMSMS